MSGNKELARSKDILFFDVETPNRRNDSICSIGLVRTDIYGNIKEQHEYLVNPEQGFDHFNINLTGISPKDVLGRPTFSELWRSELEPLFSSCILVAHNATFDLNVINKCLSTYGLEKPEVRYVCTQRTAQRFLPNVDDYKLNTLCHLFNVKLENHHNALSDALACEGLFWNIVDQFGLARINPEVFCWKDHHFSFCSDESTTCSSLMTELYSLVLGLTIDKEVTPEEIPSIESWLEKAQDYAVDPTMSYMIALVVEILKDGIVSAEEAEFVLNLTCPYVFNGHATPKAAQQQVLIGVLKGIVADGQVSEAEAWELRKWLETADSDLPLFHKTRSYVVEALENGCLSKSSASTLFEHIEELVDPPKDNGDHIEFKDHAFVLTGDFAYGTRIEVENLITSRGGIIKSGVSRKVDYVIIGSNGSEKYSYGSYGTKVEKAMELRNAGVPIRIVPEADMRF